jgi:DMSO/TMAO reductase YedYZ molybdopterin-dependent catalytic subunit
MNKNEEIVTERQVRNKTLVAFLFLLLFMAGVLMGWNWLHRQTKEQGAIKPLRTVLDGNETIFFNILSNEHLAKTYPKNMAARNVRLNGAIGMNNDFDPSSWKLKLVRSPGDTQYISLEEIKALPKTEVIFDFKCIEGWSQVTHWGGVRFSDFIKKYGLEEQAKLRFTGLVTPDEEYYVGIDNKSMMHPQTLLCYEVNGAPLPVDNGYPLRLIIPVKYGIKHLKRIGTMFFSSHRPPDYWYERGYDYFSGL